MAHDLALQAIVDRQAAQQRVSDAIMQFAWAAQQNERWARECATQGRMDQAKEYQRIARQHRASAEGIRRDYDQ